MVRALFALAGVVAAASPLQKVVTLLNDLRHKVVADGERSDSQYDTFQAWCVDTLRNKEFEAETSSAKIEQLRAVVEKADADSSTSQAGVARASESIGAHTAELNKATALQEREHADFVAEETELKDTIDMLARAQSLISRHTGSTEAVLAQLTGPLNAIVAAHGVAAADKSRLTALLQARAGDDDEADDDGLHVPSVKAYESHSKSVLSTLADMQDKAEGMLADAQRAALNAHHNYELLAQSLRNALKQNEVDLTAAKAALAGATETHGAASRDLAQESATLADSKKIHRETKVTCDVRASEFSASQRSRAEELKALKAAQAAIDEMTGAADERQYALLQTADSSAVTRAAAVLKKVGLDQLAQRVRGTALLATSSGESPFGKVKGLISAMINRLEDEASKDATHKAFCDKELSESRAKAAEHSADIDKFSARIDKAGAAASKLSAEVRELHAQLAGIAKSQAQLESMRANERAEFKSAKADFEQGIAGCQVALKVLREYYSASEALVQAPAPRVDMHVAAGAASSGIIGFIEVAESDFSRSLSEAQEAESSAQDEFERLTQDNRVSRATKQSAVAYKTKESQSMQQRAQETSTDRSSTQAELDAVSQYLTELNSACVRTPETYAEKRQRREREIAGLKDSLEILENDAASFVQLI